MLIMTGTHHPSTEKSLSLNDTSIKPPNFYI